MAENRGRFPDVLNRKHLEHWNQLVSFLESKHINDFETLCEICEMDDKYVQSDSFKSIFQFLDLVDKGKLWGTMRELCFGTKTPAGFGTNNGGENLVNHFAPLITQKSNHPLSSSQPLFSHSPDSGSPLSQSTDSHFLSKSQGNPSSTKLTSSSEIMLPLMKSASQSAVIDSHFGPLSMPPLSTATYLKNASDELTRSSSREKELIAPASHAHSNPTKQNNHTTSPNSTNHNTHQSSWEQPENNEVTHPKRPRCPEKEKCQNYINNWTCPDYHTREEFKFLNNYRTSLCPNYRFGNPQSCKAGSNCIKAHGKAKLRCPNCRQNGDHERLSCKNPKYVPPAEKTENPTSMGVIDQIVSSNSQNIWEAKRS